MTSTSPAADDARPGVPGSPVSTVSTGGPVDGPPVALLVQALESVDQAVCIADMGSPDEPLVYVNPAFTTATGFAAADALGRNCRFLQDGLDVGDAPRRIRALLAAGRSGVVTLPNRRADGEVFLNELSLSPLRDAAGVVTHYVAVQRDLTAQLRAERSRDVLRREQAELAEQLQRTLVPSSLPEVAGWSTAVRYVPAGREDGSRGEVSGDVYDLLPRPGGGWYAFIGDVSGRGPRAAASTGVLRWTVRGVATTAARPSTLLAETAAALGDALSGRFATLAVAGLPGAEGGRHLPAAAEDVVVALAGHPRPVLLPADGPARLVGRPGTLLGVLRDVVVHDVPVPVGPGDQLVLYTDGVTEAMSPDRRMLAEAGLLAALDALPPAGRTGPGAAGRTADAVLAAVDAHTGQGSTDDLTLLVVARDATA